MFFACALVICLASARFFVAAEQLFFEAASIHLNDSGSRFAGMSIYKGGRFTATNVTVKRLIIASYKIQGYQIVGGPPWMDSDHYDITAKSESEANQEQVAEMIKALLGDRFKLKSHHEVKELPVYELDVAKGGSKLKTNTDGGDNHKSSTSRGKITGQNVPLETFVTLLSNQLDRLVVDKTGLKGNYDLQLEWSPDLSRAATATDAPPPPDGTSIFTAIQEQLGLRLEAGKTAADAVVIDALERPSEN